MKSTRLSISKLTFPILIPALIPVLTIMTVINFANASSATAESTTGSVNLTTTATTKQTIASTTVNKDSLFNIVTEWKNQDAKSVHFSDFKGSYTVLAMAYTGCSYSCPMTISKLKEIETKIKEKNITNYQIVIASFDSIHDTPEKLKTYMETKKLDTTHWSMLSADKDSKVRELSVLLGISYKKEGQNDFAHSNIITLLDKEGVILVQLNGMNADNTNLLKQIQP